MKEEEEEEEERKIFKRGLLNARAKTDSTARKIAISITFGDLDTLCHKQADPKGKINP